MKKRTNFLLYYVLSCSFVVLIVSVFSVYSYQKSQWLINENINSELKSDIEGTSLFLNGDEHNRIRIEYASNNFNEIDLNTDQDYLYILSSLNDYKNSISASSIFTLNFSESLNDFYATFKIGDMNQNIFLEYVGNNTSFFTEGYSDFSEIFIKSDSVNGEKYYITIRAITRIAQVNNQPIRVLETIICTFTPKSALNTPDLEFVFSLIILIAIIITLFLGVGGYLVYVNKNSAKDFKKISYMAYYDSLTTLPNRANLIEHLTSLISENNRTRKFAIIFIDIDRFKIVNDSEGHIEGDVLLQKISLFLNSKVTGKKPNSKTKSVNLISRLGGDEFVIVYPYKSQNELLAFMNCILDDYKVLSSHDDLILKHKVSLSLGASVYPRDGENVSELLKTADIAMYCAKKFLKTNCLIYNKTLDNIIESHKNDLTKK